jgi:hypothetical protein
LAAADPTPERPHITDAHAEPSQGPLPGNAQECQRGVFADGVDFDRSSVQSYSQRSALGKQHGRPQAEALPPRPNRGVRHSELLGDRPQPQPTRHLAGQARADHLDRIQAPDEHQVWQQGM